jgi:hypothetical protein
MPPLGTSDSMSNPESSHKSPTGRWTRIHSATFEPSGCEPPHMQPQGPNTPHRPSDAGTVLLGQKIVRDGELSSLQIPVGTSRIYAAIRIPSLASYNYHSFLERFLNSQVRVVARLRSEFRSYHRSSFPSSVFKPHCADNRQLSAMSTRKRLVVLSGGSAANNLIEVFTTLCADNGRGLDFILPISDNGGSTSEILRVFGGPGIGDVRSSYL